MLTPEERAVLEPDRQEWLSDLAEFVSSGELRAAVVRKSDFDDVACLLRDLARARLEIARLKAERLDARTKLASSYDAVYLDGQEASAKAGEIARTARLDAIEAQLRQSSTWENGHIESACLSLPAEQMREMAAAGRLTLTMDTGRLLVGRWVDADKRAVKP